MSSATAAVPWCFFSWVTFLACATLRGSDMNTPAEWARLRFSGTARSDCKSRAAGGSVAREELPGMGEVRGRRHRTRARARVRCVASRGLEPDPDPEAKDSWAQVLIQLVERGADDAVALQFDVVVEHVEQVRGEVEGRAS